MNLIGRYVVVILLAQSASLAHAQNTLTTQALSPQEHRNSARVVSPLNTSNTLNKTDTSNVSPEQQFMQDVLASSNISQRIKDRSERLGVTPNNPYGNHSNGPTPWQLHTDKDAPRLIGSAPIPDTLVLQGSPAPETPLDQFTFGEGNGAGFEIGVGLKKNYGTHNLTLTPYYKRTPKAAADNLKELYSSQNSEQEVGINIRSTF